MAYMNNNELKTLRTQMNMDAPITSSMTKLNRFKMRHPSHELEKTIPHIFITKPDCYMFAPDSNGGTLNTMIGKRPEFNRALKTHPNVFASLQQDQGNPGPFINQLCNYAMSFDIQDTVIKTRDSAETANDWKIVYGHRANDSRAASTINIDFYDNRRLDVYTTFEVWVNYIDLMSKGLIPPHQDNRLNKILDYACSAYYFLTAEDGVTVLYYCKLVGVFPTNIPESVFGASNGLSTNKAEYSVQFQYSIKDTSPLVVADFMNITNSKNTDKDINPCENGVASQTWHSSVKLVEGTNGKLKLIYQRG